MSDTDSYHWSEVPVGPLGRFALGVRSSDDTPVVARSLPSTPHKDAQSRLLADAEWSVHLGPQIAIQPLPSPPRGDPPQLILAPGNFLPLSARRHVRLAVVDAVRLGRAAAVVLARLHSKGFVHGALCPQSLWVDEAFGDARVAALDLCFTDAGQVQRRPQHDERQDLRYLAPELFAGGAHADRRADLYALGVVLYESLTGRLPFIYADSVAIRHAHSAIEAEPVKVLRGEVPAVLSDLVASLLAKDPDERYQSACGLKRDCDRILAASDAAATPPSDLVGRQLRDLPVRPSTIQGRERERDAIAKLFADPNRGVFGLVTGSSGSGKSVLLEQTISALDGGLLIGWGRCDQVGKEPFEALRTSLESILLEIDTADDDSRLSFVQAVSSALSGTGAALHSIVPGVERYLEAPPDPAPGLSAQGGEHRVHAAFHSLLSALGSGERPVVIVLDDVQWADAATLAVLKSVALAASAPPVTFVLLYRADEIVADSDLADTIAAIGAHPALGMKLELGPLGNDDIRALVAHCLEVDEQEIAPLAKTIDEHSHGNPLFAIEELHELSRSGSLYRDAESGAWTWNSAEISALRYTQKLSELITLRLHRLPTDTRRLVAQAACFGQELNIHALAEIADISVEELRQELAPAVRDGLLVATTAPGATEMLRFGHDQIRGAAYEMFDETERAQVHLQIGNLLLRSGNESTQGLVDAIAHLNAASSVLRQEGRGLWLAKRNLEAARIVGEKAAFADAYGYLVSALDLLDEQAWHNDYELTRDVHLAAARAACRSSAASSALPLIDQLRRFAGTAVDEVAALEVAVEAFKVLDRFEDAVNSGLDALAMLEIRLPRAPSALGPVVGLLATHWKISRLGTEHLTQLQSMDDPRALAAMRILAEIATPAFLVMPALFPALVNAQLRLSLEFGNAPESANAYALYAVILAGPLRRVAKAHDVSVAALRVLEDADRSQVPRTYMAVYVFVMPWTRPLAECLEIYLEGSRTALAVGAPEFANYLASAYAAFSVHAGPTLSIVGAELERLRKRIEPFGQQRQYAADIYHQFVLNLQSADGDPLLLAGPIYDQVADGAQHADAPEMNGHSDLVRLILAVAFDRFEGLDELLKGFRSSLKPFNGMYVRAVFFFYEALALLRSDGGIAARLQASIVLTRLRRWSRHAPQNFLHKEILLRAAIARARGRLRRAQALFEEAATSAERAGFRLEAGLALEGAHAVAAERGLHALSRHYMDEARRVYQDWGCLAKVRELGIRFGAQRSVAGAIGEGANSGRVWDLAPATLDMVGVLEASQALSAGMELEATIRKIMQTVVGLSGAQRGVLLSDGDLGFSVLARAETLGANLHVEVFAENDAGTSGGVATPFATRVVEEVVASGSPLILIDPAEDPRFSEDPYLQKNSPRALLCCPIAHGDQRTAVLYLEHHLRRDAFGAGQMETVRLLSTQAAISLDNARLYARQLRLSTGAQRFVPYEFLHLLGKGDVDDVELSDHMEAEMTILVTDIRGFTSTTETMSPKASFAYINDFFTVVGPTVRDHHGFVIKYMGDGLMAVFPGSPDDAAAAALAIPERLEGLRPFPVGIGLHTGPVAVGAVGELRRIQADVMSDVVTVACRLESLTRQYNVPVVMSAATRERLSEPLRERTYALGRTAVKGREESIDVYSFA